MDTTRRELLGAGASAALGLLPLGSGAATAQTASTANAAQPGWDDGELAHLLPTSNHNRILIKASFRSRWRPHRPCRSAISALAASVRIPADCSGSSRPPI